MPLELTSLTLLDKQRLFVRLLGQLIEFAYARGWEFTLGDAYRPDGKGHMPGSLHYSRLAIDLNLFVDGVYVRAWHPAWDELGVVWKALHPLARWGGDFKAKDYNHFSVEHGGKA